MKRLSLYFLLTFIFLSSFISAQVVIEGYVFQSDNRGFLNRVHVRLVESATNSEVGETLSDMDGFFTFKAELNKEYKIIANKEMFEEMVELISTSKNVANGKVFARVEMKRAPGYVFEITMAEKREDPDIPVDAIRGALIEVYNNTTEKLDVIFEDHPHPDFQVNLLKGNHYTILIRKQGYLAKRLEAYVDVEGCILCFEGVGKVEPGVSDNLTEGNEMGVLLANLELERIEQDKTFEINNLYYDYGKWELKPEGRAELNKVINLFKDNPALIIELGSHTDSRGKSNKNQELSEKRAQSAVSYLKTYGNIPPENIVARGYGESKILNKCKDGVDCSESQHARNRRTELKIIGERSDFTFKSLIELKEEEKMEALIRELQNQDQVRVKEGEKLSDVLEKDELGLKETEEVKQDLPKSKPVLTETKKANESEEAKGVKEKANDQVKEEVKENNPTPPASDLTHRIVIHFSYQPLPSNHAIYKEHKDVYEYISPQNYRYYLIEAFSSEADAHDALEDKWLEKYPNAYIMTFKGDERIN
ncbi:MAG: OmpA family protein [Saprospiraceae bacterium]|nr:OmpA family protein [Saprospiraceae bacterium]